MCVFCKGVSNRWEQDILHMWTNICFSRRTILVWHSPAQTWANNAATAFLTNNGGRGSCTDGSKPGHTRTFLPAHGLLLHWLLSDPSGHICCHIEQHLDFRSMRESVTDLKDTFRKLLCIWSYFEALYVCFWKRNQAIINVLYFHQIKQSWAQYQW